MWIPNSWGHWAPKSMFSWLQGGGKRASGSLHHIQGWSECCILILLLIQGESSKQLLLLRWAGVETKVSISCSGLMVGSESASVTQAYSHRQEGNRLCCQVEVLGQAGGLTWFVQSRSCFNTQMKARFYSHPGESSTSSELRKMLLLQTESHKIALKWFGEGSLDLVLPRKKEDFDDNMPRALDTWSHVILTTTYCISTHSLNALFHPIWSIYSAGLGSFTKESNLYRFTQLVRDRLGIWTQDYVTAEGFSYPHYQCSANSCYLVLPVL